MERATKAITLTIVGSLAAYLGYQGCGDDGKHATSQPSHSHWFWGRPFYSYGGTSSSGIHSSSSRGGFGGSSHFAGG